MEWRDVPGFEGRYEVSDEGQVRSVADPSDIHSRRRGGILRAARSKGGHGRGQAYLLVNLVNAEGKSVSVRVHRAVALAFLGERPAGAEVRHLDGDAHNNRVENLAWGSHAENVQDTVRHGRHGPGRTAVCPRGHVKFDPLPMNRCRECRRIREARRYLDRKAARADERKADAAHAHGYGGGM